MYPVGQSFDRKGDLMIYTEISVQVEGSANDARLQAYILDTPHDGRSLKIEKRPLILICPGGGYERTSY